MRQQKSKWLVRFTLFFLKSSLSVLLLPLFLLQFSFFFLLLPLFVLPFVLFFLLGGQYLMNKISRILVECAPSPTQHLRPEYEGLPESRPR